MTSRDPRHSAGCRDALMAADGMRHEVEEPIPPRIPLVEGAPGKDKELLLPPGGAS
jgi:hypothetical protein